MTLLLYPTGMIDFEPRACNLTFGPGNSTGDVDCADITIINDDYKEENESFTFAICPDDDAAHLLGPDSAFADVYIIDDDSKS